MPSLLIAVDTNFNITQGNRQAEEKIGKPISTVIGLQLMELCPWMDTEIEMIEKAMASRKRQYQIIEKDAGQGRRRYEEVIAYPLLTNGVETVVLMIADITEQQNMQEELSHSRKLDAIGQLAGGVAHDFNNMLGGILGAAELLSLTMKSDDHCNKYLDIITNSAKNAAGLTEKLLAFARKGKVESMVVDVKNAIDDTISILGHTLNRKIRIQTDLRAKKTKVIGDLIQLQNMLLNLGINAGHAMPDGGTLRYEIENIILDDFHCSGSGFDLRPGEYIKIEVIDAGVGISPDNINKIFDPVFYDQS